MLLSQHQDRCLHHLGPALPTIPVSLLFSRTSKSPTAAWHTSNEGLCSANSFNLVFSWYGCNRSTMACRGRCVLAFDSTK